MLDLISDGTQASQLHWISQCHHLYMYIWDPPTQSVFPFCVKSTCLDFTVNVAYCFSRYNVTANNGLFNEAVTSGGGPTDR